jgi:hypothetical protein
LHHCQSSDFRRHRKPVSMAHPASNALSIAAPQCDRVAGVLFPAAIDADDDLVKTAYVLPDDALREVRFPPPAVDEAAAD